MSGHDHEAEQEKREFAAVFRRRMLIGFTIGGLLSLAIAAWLNASENWVYAMCAGPALIATPFWAAFGGAIAILCGTRSKRSKKRC